MKVYYTTEHLAHYGIPKRSGRYPYGSGERPFQSGGGGIISRWNARRKEKKVVKQRNENLKKARDAAAEKRQFEKEKKEILNRANPEEILKYKDRLTTDEIIAANARRTAITNMEKLYKTDLEKGFNKVDKVLSKTKNVANWMESSYKIYKTADTFMKDLDEVSKRKKQKESSESGE